MNPDVTTEKQLYQIIESRGMQESCKTFNNEKESGVRGISCLNKVVIAFGYQTDIVFNIVFQPSEMIHVQEVIEKFGSPDHVVVASNGRTGKYEEIASLLIFYDKFHMVLNLVQKIGIEYSVDADTPVDSVAYVNSESYYEGEDQFIPWDGYGRYYCKSCLP